MGLRLPLTLKDREEKEIKMSNKKTDDELYDKDKVYPHNLKNISYTELCNSYKEFATIVKKDKKPICVNIDKNNKSILMSVEQYLDLIVRLEFHEAWAAGEADIAAGRVRSAETAFAELKEKYSKKK